MTSGMYQDREETLIGSPVSLHAVGPEIHPSLRDSNL